ncbi:MAG: nuclease-related domain-containing protein, partial [Desulfuromonadales bacterium]|nr:nuclease-related domain-containing protein [Desulfuromonadales bacterium]
LLIYWGTSRLYQLLKQRRNLYLGLDAEMAVGQELNHLMLHGCRVFHDFPAKKFNIDHVVIGPGGVIAVETKGRAKRDQGGGSADAKVIFNGEYLRFPGWLEKNPVLQARRQAVWLQKWLTSAVGQTVKVRPALALAGWYVERTKTGDVLVYNGKSPVFLTNPNITGDRLSPEMIQRIVHQVELRCRDVEPVAYRKETPKK